MLWVVRSDINSYSEENAELCSSVENQLELDFLKWSGWNLYCIHILFLIFPYFVFLIREHSTWDRLFKWLRWNVVSYAGATLRVGIIKWLCMKGKKILQVICKPAWSIVVSYVWLQRNALVFNGNVKSKVTILLIIRRDNKA